MSIYKSSSQKRLNTIGLTLTLLAFSINVTAETTQLSNSPLVTTPTDSVLPNILFVLDDSGSMDWDYMPDWSNDTPPGYTSLPSYLSRNGSFNGVFYNAGISYTPPIKSDGTYHSSMTSANTTAWTLVPNDGYGIQSTASSNLVGTANFYTMVAGEYCSTPNLKTCITASAPSTGYLYPSNLRWCNSAALTTCQSVNTSTFNRPRSPVPRTSTITVTSSTSITSIKVDAVEILSVATTASGSTTTDATNIRNSINACTSAKTGLCGDVGYSATVASNVVTISAPGATISTPVTIPATGTTKTAFSSKLAGVTGTLPGANLRTDIIATNNSYPYPGSASKATGRTDCAGTTCTYAEEMTNYANWWTYYHTRMQMMKTSAAQAFSAICSDPDPSKCAYRLGYLSINNNTSSDFLNLSTFDATQKATWYDKLVKAEPNNSTPLRTSLTKAGRLYAGKFNGTTLNGSIVKDPIQYSCQQNFTILSTDGYWNDGSNPDKIDGSTDIGNTDNAQDRPMHDGTINGATTTTTTVTDTTPTTTIVRKQTVKGQSVSTPYSRSYKTTAASKGTNGCNSSRYAVITQNQSYTRLATQTLTTVDDYTTTSTHTVVTTNGVVTSDTTSAPSTIITNISSVTTPLTDNGAPTGSSTWTNGSTSVSCQSSPTPAPGTSSTPTTPTSGSSTTTTTSGPTVTTLSTNGPTVGATVTTTVVSTSTTPSSGGTTNTLADVAQYYYWEDLRDASLSNCTGAKGDSVCLNNVPASGLDSKSSQHMTTFTLGLGASGLMQYTTDYASASIGDYYDVRYGTAANGSLCTWQASGSGACNWPTPTSGNQTTIDDLWHAGVNGRGAYFSASNPTSLSSSLTNALAGVSTRLGASAAATTSNPNVTTGDNFVFSSTFLSQEWTGQLVRQTLDLVTGAVSPYADWTARSQLDLLAHGSRKLYTFDSGVTNNLKPFTYADLTADEQKYFETPYIAPLSQLCAAGANCLTPADQVLASGSKLVDFLRGDRSYEGTLDPAKYYRTRSHLLGDIVNAEAAYIKNPQQKFVDRGYADFASDYSAREGMVYVAANDGMLHVFKAGGSTVVAGDGVEQWAYIPSAMLPSLYKLADKEYATQHQFFVDGTPTQGDICTSNCAATDTGTAVWKTILVGGFNAGGRGYYALDVTDPATPKALWEFNHDNMGYSYGNPNIVKLNDGTWVVLLTSGYNNVPPYAPSGDGKGYLFVVNASTGALIRAISTGVGSATTTVTGCATSPCPSGLSKIIAQVSNPGYDSTVIAAYGGDLYGNVWRFDPNDTLGASGYDAQLLASLTGPTGTIQPITSKPEMGVIDNNVVVFVGTGSYLGIDDVTDLKIQGMYAIKDTLGTTSYGAPRDNTCASSSSTNCFVKQTYNYVDCPAGTPASICSSGEKVTTSTSNPVDFTTQNGWYADYPVAGERSNTDPILVLGTLLFTTNTPDTTACTAGGYSSLYFLDYTTGGPVSSSSNGIVGESLGNSLATRPVVVLLPNGSIVVEIMMAAPSTSGAGSGSGSTSCIGGDCLQAKPQDTTPPLNPPSPTPRRASWREIIIDK